MPLATAHITEANDLFIVRYQNAGSFLVGEQMFGNINAALRFCRIRGLSVSF